MRTMWYEIWADEGLAVPYILIVQPSEDERLVVIRDPREGSSVIHIADDYESARFWLAEDEYCLVTGRMFRESLES